MKYHTKGNYYFNKFHLAPISGIKSVEKTISKNSPADLKQHLWTLPVEPQDINKVIESASKGFRTWRNLDSAERCNYLKKYQNEISKRKDQIAEAISLESGKPLWEAHTEVNAIISKVDVTINEGLERIKNIHIDNISPNTDGYVFYKPVGPCLIIGPFNFPCHLANGQILSALAAGNSIIFKPSEKTAYSGQLLIECFHEAKLPEGTINLIQGHGEIARRLLKEKSIKGVFFTGSKEVGLDILKETHQDLSKIVALELGGKNTCIVHEDANIDYALVELLKACFLTSGQRCVSTSKIAIHENLKDEFINKFHNLAKKIVIDHPINFEKEPFMGPLIDHRSVENYLVYMGMAIREGAQEIMRGKKLQKTYEGNYVTPSIHYMETINHKSHFLASEIFGPNVTFIPYKDIDQACEIVNMSEYGLAAGVFSNNDELYNYFINNLDVGVVNFNRSTCGSSAKLPFGGIKNSGNYRPAALATIDSCVYQLSSLKMKGELIGKIDDIPGLSN